MTKKDVIRLATDKRAMELMQEIADEHANLCYKTLYECKSAERRMEDKAAIVIEILRSIKLCEDLEG